jgi:hypothetical protein
LLLLHVQLPTNVRFEDLLRVGDGPHFESDLYTESKFTIDCGCADTETDVFGDVFVSIELLFVSVLLTGLLNKDKHFRSVRRSFSLKSFKVF